MALQDPNYEDLHWTEQIKKDREHDMEEMYAHLERTRETARKMAELADQKRREEANPSFFKKLQKLFA